MIQNLQHQFKFKNKHKIQPSAMSSKQPQLNQEQIHEYIKEYLKYWDLNTSLQSLEDEVKSKENKRNIKNAPQTKLESIMKNPPTKSKHEVQLQKQNKAQNKKYQEVLQAGRQIFSVSINLLQIIHNIKEGGSKYDYLNQAIENYKIQLGKHHKIIINEGKVEGSELISENVIRDHKAKLEQYVAERTNTEGIIEILLSLRINALQIAPELRKNLVEELIRRDIFKITQQQKDNFKFLLGLLAIKNNSLKHAITSLISVIVSTIKGIEYITYNGSDVIIKRVIKILQEQEDGNVTQRFCLGILQKCSVKQNLIATYIDSGLIDWVLKLVESSFKTKIHMFCLDFSTAMLANIIHSKWCHVKLAEKPDQTVYIMDNILKFIKHPMEVSVLMHLLITLSYLCKPKFKKQMQEVNLVKRINQFVEYYENSFNKDGEAAEMDKKTVLDLCSHMFHGKEQEYDTEERIRQYENGQGELIFECFQDEVS